MRNPKRKRKVHPGRLLLVIILALAVPVGGVLGMWMLLSKTLQSPQIVSLSNRTQQTRLRLTVTGDILLEEPMLNYFGSGDWQGYMDGLASWFREDDLTIANLEVPIGGEELGITGINFSFNAPAQTAQNMKDAGIDFVSLANNHAFDRGMQGVVNTQAYLESAGIFFTGTNTQPNDQLQSYILEKDGIRLGFVSYTYNCNQPITEPYAVNAYYSAWDDRSDALIEDIQHTRSLCDILIVSMHWGNEFTYEINEEQAVLAKALSNAGADVIIGNHPHCIQPASWIESESGRKTLCFYSMGNLASSAVEVDRASELFQNMYQIGLIAEFDIVKTADGSFYLEEVNLIPVVNHFEDGYQNYHLIPLKNYTDDLAAQHGQAQASELFNVSFLKEQVFSVLSSSGMNIDLPA